MSEKVIIPQEIKNEYNHQLPTSHTTIMEPATPSIPEARVSGNQKRHGYLFGKKLAASMSPLFHNTLYKELGLQWEQRRLDSDDIPKFLELIRQPEIYGCAVTMPNKVTILPHLDYLTPECIAVGACNTIYLRPSPSPSNHHQQRLLLCGTNTDTIGVRESFYQNVPCPDTTFHDKPALVLGGGGAARSAIYALWRWMRATKIYLVNRDAGEVEAVMRDCSARGYGDNLIHVKTEKEAEILQVPGAIVACVPDLKPVTDEEKEARAVVDCFLRRKGEKRKGAMLEMCYNPTPYTELGGLAEGYGWQVILGTEALIWQGLEQDRYWTGLEMGELPVGKVREVIAGRLAQISKL